MARKTAYGESMNKFGFKQPNETQVYFPKLNKEETMMKPYVSDRDIKKFRASSLSYSYDASVPQPEKLVERFLSS